jgi:hypothetical protein
MPDELPLDAADDEHEAESGLELPEAGETERPEG